MEANDNTEASSPFSVSNLLFPVRENSPEIVGEDEKQGNGPRTPAECEEDKKVKFAFILKLIGYRSTLRLSLHPFWRKPRMLRSRMRARLLSLRPMKV